MPSIASLLKQEISRLARREARALVMPLQQDKVWLKRRLRDVNRRLAHIEKSARVMEEALHRQATTQSAAVAEDQRVRITSKGVRSLRRKLRLTQDDFARLLSVTPQAVYQWERKDGAIRMRERTRAAYLGSRRIGAREAKWRIERMAPAKTAAKTPARPRRKK